MFKHTTVLSTDLCANDFCVLERPIRRGAIVVYAYLIVCTLESKQLTSAMVKVKLSPLIVDITTMASTLRHL